MAAPVSAAERRFMTSGIPRQITIRLNANENPYGPSAKAREAIGEVLAEANRYPSGSLEELKKVLAEKEGVTPGHILVGAGSSDLLCATGVAFGVEDGPILSAFPTFPMLMNYSTVFNARWDKADVTDKLETDYPLLASKVTGNTRLVYVCNPNNPTGTFTEPSVVKSFCEEVSSRVPVFVDEAYLEFLQPSWQVSMADLVRRDMNVIVARTFSKIHGLAGLRIGYVVARPDIARKISRYHPGIPCNQAGLAAATASLADTEFMASVRQKNAQARKHLTDYLDAKKYFYGKPAANFVMFEPPSDAYQLMNALGRKGIGIRVWDYKDKQWCRVSVGTLEEMKIFTQTMESLS